MKSIREIYKISKGPSSSHTNAMDFIALQGGSQIGTLRVESISCGDVRIPGTSEPEREEVYIERNAVAAMRAMHETGINLSHRFRKTSEVGLAKLYDRKRRK